MEDRALSRRDLTVGRPQIRQTGNALTYMTAKNPTENSEALELQRELQQGKGRPIRSNVAGGYRYVRVGNRIYKGTWLTVHDFLLNYLFHLFGEQWWKCTGPEHPLKNWFEILKQHRKEIDSGSGEVRIAESVAAEDLCLQLAYDLFTIANNQEVQEALIRRLKNGDQFHGAVYETHVAAVVIRAGFQIEFEDESDPSGTHCEFTATYVKTGKKFSVEAKARQEGNWIRNQLYKALKKKANHPRIVFIGVKVLHALLNDTRESPIVDEIVQQLQDTERNLTIDSAPAPPAYVFFTNRSHEHHLGAKQFYSYYFFYGFKIPDIFDKTAPLPLKEHVESRKKHEEIYALARSMDTHVEVPSTFDGQIPVFAFNRSEDRLIIGERYLVPDSDGIEREGTLIDASVNMDEGKVYGYYELDNAKTIITSSELSKPELRAYEQHPDTFFGIVRPQGRRSDTPIEMYEFMLETYNRSSRETLLDLLKNADDFNELSRKKTEELAEIYCQRTVESIFNKQYAKDETDLDSWRTSRLIRSFLWLSYVGLCLFTIWLKPVIGVPAVIYFTSTLTYKHWKAKRRAS